MAPNVILQAPSDKEYGAFYTAYVAAVKDGDILETLRSQGRSTCALFESLSDEQARWRYAPGKWSIKEIAGHLADGERVFSYRALRIGRGDATPLPGFEQDDYISNARFDDLSMQQLVKEVASKTSDVAGDGACSDDLALRTVYLRRKPADGLGERRTGKRAGLGLHDRGPREAPRARDP